MGTIAPTSFYVPFLCIRGCFACRFICVALVCLLFTEVSSGYYPGTGITDDYELPCGCLETSLGLLEEQPLLLPAKLSFSRLYLVLSFRLINLGVCVFCMHVCMRVT